MSYFDESHKLRIRNLNEMWGQLTGIEELASQEYDIGDLAQDNNLKLLQTLILFDLKNQSGREGWDARSMCTLLSEIITPFKSSIVIANSLRIKSKFA